MRPLSGSSTIARLPIVSETDGAVGVQHLRLRFDVDRLGQAADLQHGVRADDLVVGDLDAGRLEGLEAGHA